MQEYWPAFVLKDEMIQSCQDGNLAKLSRIIEVDQQQGFLTDDDKARALNMACAYGQKEVFLHLLHHQLLTDEEMLHLACKSGFDQACGRGCLNIVQCFLKELPCSESLVEFEIIDLYSGLTMACLNKSLDVIKWILQEFGHQIDIHFNEDRLFNYALINGNIELIEFLVLEHGIEKTQEIEAQLQQHPDIKKFFDKRHFDELLGSQDARKDKKMTKI